MFVDQVMWEVFLFFSLGKVEVEIEVELEVELEVEAELEVARSMDSGK